MAVRGFRWPIILVPFDENVQRILNRIGAAIRMCFPDDMTPRAKHILELVLEDEQQRLHDA